MSVLRWLLRRIADLLGRYPGYAVVGVFAFPWALFSVTTEFTTWFSVWELAAVVGAAAGLVASAVRLGVRAGKWPLVLAIYASVLNLGIAEFAYLYWSTSQTRHSAFSKPLSRVDAAYFSWTTFTTTGFGDITARSQFARLEVTGEMVLTFVGVAGGLAVLVGLRKPLGQVSSSRHQGPT